MITPTPASIWCAPAKRGARMGVRIMTSETGTPKNHRARDERKAKLMALSRSDDQISRATNCEPRVAVNQNIRLRLSQMAFPVAAEAM